ncbi:undecaprenyl-diphosphate phosphatase [Candidatus Pelagibacter sp.]|nr:undecaprenyl-diphosphate phosphatase [Candidatus Pelagibacter sp.]|tara:strand:- start:349 stop:1119 length:771 start_codon:yes stop_codon:yes gene_type:complete
MLSNITEIIILSIVQGISEFLPISSSAHLNIVEIIFEFNSNSLMIDVSLHLGSLLAIIFYFRRELLDLKNNRKLLSLMIIGSIPIIIAGYIISTMGLINLLENNLKIIAWTTLIFGIVLYIADKNKINKKISSNLNLKTILYIGLFQTLALVPGVSRAGITITAARLFRFNRFESSKISFLLAIPAIVGASVLQLKNAIGEGFEINYLILVSITFSFLFSYFTVKFFLKYINKFSLNIFVIYRIIISIILFIIIYN